MDVELVGRVLWGGKGTNAWELGATVTALWRAALLLGVLVLELSPWGLDDSDFVGTCVVSGRNPSVSIPIRRAWTCQACCSQRDLRISPSLRIKNVSIGLSRGDRRQLTYANLAPILTT